MDIDINAAAKSMLDAIKGTVKEDWPHVKATAEKFVQKKKVRLKMIADLRIKGDLTQERFISRLNDEKLIAEAELNALAVLSKAMAQKAANAAIKVLEDLVSLAIKKL